MRSLFAVLIASLLALSIALYMTTRATIATETRTLATQSYSSHAAIPLASLSQAAKPQTAARIALVIGNSDYPQKPLVSPVKDAQAMAAQLAKLGFYVIKQENVSVKALRRSLSEFSVLLQATQAVGLFYYAGHGIQVDGVNYLMPIDIDLKQANNVRQQSMSLNRVLYEVGQASNSTHIVIIDACRDNPFPDSPFQRGLAPLSYSNTPGNTLIAFATAPGNVAIDGDDNGLFTKHLLANFSSPDLPIEQLFKRVRQGVMHESNGSQIPWENSSLTSDFYFNPADRSTIVSTSLDVASSVSSAAQDELVTAAANSQSLKVDSRQLRLGPALSRSPAQVVPTAAPISSAAGRDDNPILAYDGVAAEIDRYLNHARTYLQQADFAQGLHYLDQALSLYQQASTEQIETMTDLTRRYTLALTKH